MLTALNTPTLQLRSFGVSRAMMSLGHRPTADLKLLKPNTSMLRFPDGKVYATLPITNGGSSKEGCALRRSLCKQWNVPYYSAASVAPFKAIGAEFVPGFQLRYIYLIDPTAKQRLAIPVLPFSKIQEAGAAMYKGVTMTTRGKQATNTSSVSAAGQHRPPRSNSSLEAS